ncbi:MAG: hypothetical protein AAB417_03065 [Patescibacteria group bacterium]
MQSFFESWQGRVVLLLLLVGGAFLIFSYSSQSSSEKDHKLSRDFTQPKSYGSLDDLMHAKDTDCIDLNCFDDYFSDITQEYGPEPALLLLARYQETGKITRSLDDHQLAHRIGRKTAEMFGVNPQAFDLCGTSFNYGCQHGFFEYVLGHTDTTKDAATLICESIDGSKPPKSRFYCYHGVGHGVMMARANDIFESVRECDTLVDATAQDGCWQGAFMENVNAGMKGESKSNVFSETDPLAPCNKVEEKYRHECFINHAGWLMRFFSNDTAKASAACLKAPEANQSACAQSIGLMVTNPSWQPALLSNAGAKSFEDASWAICKMFPIQLRRECMIGAVDNIVNFDELKGARAGAFCKRAPADLADDCWRVFGRNLTQQTTDQDIIRTICLNTAPPAYQQICLNGAGIHQ